MSESPSIHSRASTDSLASYASFTNLERKLDDLEENYLGHPAPGKNPPEGMTMDQLWKRYVELESALEEAVFIGNRSLSLADLTEQTQVKRKRKNGKSGVCIIL